MRPIRAYIWMVHTCTRTYVSTYVYSACSSCPVPRTAYPLVPWVNGSLPRLLRSDLLRRSTPLRTASRSLRSSPAPSSHLHSVSTSSSSLLRVIQCLASLGSFVLSFVRSCYSCREQPGVSETSMRDSSSFLVSSLRPYPFPFALPFPPPPTLGYPRAPLFSAAPSLPLSNPARFHG